MVVCDVPLLVESKAAAARPYVAVIVVEAPIEIRLDRLESSLAEHAADHDAERRVELDDVRKRIQALGEVNLGAIEERTNELLRQYKEQEQEDGRGGPEQARSSARMVVRITSGGRRRKSASNEPISTTGHSTRPATSASRPKSSTSS